MSDTLPPVGATVTGCHNARVVLRYAPDGEARWGFLVVDEDGETPVESNFTDHAAYTRIWQLEQARQAYAERLARFEALAREAYGGLREPHTLSVWALQIIDRLAQEAKP